MTDLYDMAMGVNAGPMITVVELSQRLGVEESYCQALCDALESQGLIESSSMGHYVGISHKGIRVVDAEMGGPIESDTPVSNINIYGAGDHQVAVGSANVLTSNKQIMASNSVIQMLIEALGSRDVECPNEVNQLLESVQSESLDRMKIASSAEAVAKLQNSWSNSLKDFLLQASSSAAGNVVFEAIKFGAGHLLFGP